MRTHLIKMSRDPNEDRRAQYAALVCDHSAMAPCCEPDCGHYRCPCGISWDDGAFGSWGFDGPWDGYEP